jgi:hypothetical protein
VTMVAHPLYSVKPLRIAILGDFHERMQGFSCVAPKPVAS